jgi:hypothetical protein
MAAHGRRRIEGFVGKGKAEGREVNRKWRIEGYVGNKRRGREGGEKEEPKMGKILGCLRSSNSLIIYSHPYYLSLI